VRLMSPVYKRWYKTRGGLKRGLIVIPRGFLLVLCLLLGILYCFWTIDRNLKPTIIQIADARAHLIATEAINQALYEKVLYNTDYEDLVTIHKDADQKVTLMQANTMKISRIVSEASMAIKEILRNLEGEVFKIPLGQALGSALLANYGPKINVKILPVGAVKVSFDDRFLEAGINQVRHLLYLDIQTTVKVVVPLVSEHVAVKHQIPIAETIIVGAVPDTYVGLNKDTLIGGND
jgi:sporulation protein YunB